jgi:hypothetical protein
VATPDATTERAIARVLDDFHDAAAHADEERYFAHFAQGGVFLGTDATERWDVPAFRAYAHPRFVTGKGWTLVPRARHLSMEGSHGDVVWFDETLDSPGLGPCRGSGVLIRAGSTWKVAQYNLTITVPNERFAEVKRLLSKD